LASDDASGFGNIVSTMALVVRHARDPKCWGLIRHAPTSGGLARAAQRHARGCPASRKKKQEKALAEHVARQS